MNFSWTMPFSALHYPFELFFFIFVSLQCMHMQPFLVCEMNVYMCLVACVSWRLTRVFSSIFFYLALLHRISQLILELLISQIHPQIPCLCLLSTAIIGRPPFHLDIYMSFQMLVFRMIDNINPWTICSALPFVLTCNKIPFFSSVS